MKTGNLNNFNVDNYRKLVQTYIDMNIYEGALFWAEKIVALCGHPKDVYKLAQCMYLLKQYHRAVHLLQMRNLDKTYIMCNYLAVKCLLDAKEYLEALKLIELINIPTLDIKNASNSGTLPTDLKLFDDSPPNQTYSALLLLKGKLLEAMDNRGLAADCYKQALHFDVYSFEAFDSLIKHQMLTAQEERDLLNSLPITEQCNSQEAEVIKILYESKLKKYHTTIPEKTQNAFEDTADGVVLNLPENCPLTPLMMSSPAMISTPNITEENPLLVKLRDSVDLHVAEAERLYYNCDYAQCMVMTEAILKQDPYHSGCLPIHISCLVELKQSTKLFTLAHNLVDLYPNLAISWYAVGCYYHINGKSDCARRYLLKASSLDRLFGPAWLAYGHSFAVDKEHDQAMAAYFKASLLMKGCHLPLLYIGMECGLTNNVRLAIKFFLEAQNSSPDDPFTLHEKGVIAFQNQEYELAELNFKSALQHVRKTKKTLIPERWVALLNNLGHTCRKLKKFDEALEYHHEALVLSPQSPKIFSAIAYCYALKGCTQEAMDWFHKALGLERDDTFGTTMLNYLMEQLCDESPAFPGAPSYIPQFYKSGTEGDTSEQQASVSSESDRIDYKDIKMEEGNTLVEEDMADVSDMIKL